MNDKEVAETLTVRARGGVGGGREWLRSSH